MWSGQAFSTRSCTKRNLQARLYMADSSKNSYESPSFVAKDRVPSVRDHGCLPDWQTGDLPEPLPFNVRNILRTIGPGAILLAASIGGGEWIVGPMVAVKYGTEILWIASVAIFLQMIFNLEAIRYKRNPGDVSFWRLQFTLSQADRYDGWHQLYKNRQCRTAQLSGADDGVRTWSI